MKSRGCAADDAEEDTDRRDGYAVEKDADEEAEGDYEAGDEDGSGGACVNEDEGG